VDHELPEALESLWEKLNALPPTMRHEARLDFLNGILGALQTRHLRRLQKLFATEIGMPEEFRDLVDGHLALRTLIRRPRA
jgi:hypothetical protein